MSPLPSLTFSLITERFSGQYELWCFHLIVYNLPASARVRQDHDAILSIVPGPHEPKCMQDCLSHIAGFLQKLEQGFLVDPNLPDRPRQVCLVHSFLALLQLNNLFGSPLTIHFVTLHRNKSVEFSSWISVVIHLLWL